MDHAVILREPGAPAVLKVEAIEVGSPASGQVAQRLFQALADRIITADQCHEYALADVAQAHADLEARRTTGAVLLKI
jgi:hypothetical protein